MRCFMYSMSFLDFEDRFDSSLLEKGKKMFHAGYYGYIDINLDKVPLDLFSNVLKTEGEECRVLFNSSYDRALYAITGLFLIIPLIQRLVNHIIKSYKKFMARGFKIKILMYRELL